MRVECTRFKYVNKGFLVGSFTVAFPDAGLIVRDCTLFAKEGRYWWSFPSKKVFIRGKDNWIPYVSFADKERLDDLRRDVLDAVQEFREQMNNQSDYDDTTQQPTNPFSNMDSVGSFGVDIPF